MDYSFESFEHMLALYPNVKGFGYAYFQEEMKLKHYGMSVSHVHDNGNYLKRMEKMIHDFSPKIILIPTVNGKYNRKRSRVQELIGGIAELGKNYGIPVVSYSREHIRLVFEKFGAKSKLEIAEKICTWFPELRKYCPVKRRNYMPESYYQGIFDAISLAIVHAYEK